MRVTVDEKKDSTTPPSGSPGPTAASRRARSPAALATPRRAGRPTAVGSPSCDPSRRTARPQPPQIHVMAIGGGEPRADHRHPARRRQSRMGARRQDDRLLVGTGPRPREADAAKAAGDKPRESDVRVITEAVYRANGVAGVRLRRPRPARRRSGPSRCRPARATPAHAEAVDVRRVRRQQSPLVAGRIAASSSSSDRRRESVLLRQRQRPLLRAEGRRRAGARRQHRGPHRRLRAVARRQTRRVRRHRSPANPSRSYSADRSLGRRARRRRRRAISPPATTSTSTAGSAAISARRAADCRLARSGAADGRSHPDQGRRAGQRQPQAHRRRDRKGRRP